MPPAVRGFWAVTSSEPENSPWKRDSRPESRMRIDLQKQFPFSLQSCEELNCAVGASIGLNSFSVAHSTVTRALSKDPPLRINCEWIVRINGKTIGHGTAQAILRSDNCPLERIINRTFEILIGQCPRSDGNVQH
jgi:hypothetical protein